MAGRMNVDANKLHETLKATVFKNATNEELLTLVVVSNEYGLNPMLKEIYAFPAKGGGIVPVVSVDGWNKMLIRHPDFDGIEFEMANTDEGHPYSCTATVSIKGRSKPVKVTEYFDECARTTDPWKQMPRRMLRHKVLIQAARLAFGFSGVMDREEADEVIEVRSESVPAAMPGQRQVPDHAGSTDKPPLQQLSEVLQDNGISADQFISWAVKTNQFEPGMTFEEISTEDATRFLRARKTLIDSVKGGAK